MVGSTPSAIKGRALRSGRTLGRESLGESVGSESLETAVDSSEEESEMEVGGVWEAESDNNSTASSDISDWTAEAGINFRAPTRKSRRRRRRR